MCLFIRPSVHLPPSIHLSFRPSFPPSTFPYMHTSELLWTHVAQKITNIYISSVAQSCPTLCDPRDCSMPAFPVHHQPPELIQTHVYRVSDAVQPSHPLPSPSRAFNLSQHQGLFSSSHQVAKLLKSFQWIFRVDWLDLLAVQGTLKSLLQQHSSKASILRCLAFFMVQLLHPYMIITGKTIALTIWIFVGKVMSLLFKPSCNDLKFTVWNHNYICTKLIGRMEIQQGPVV